MKIKEVRTRAVRWRGKTVPLPPHFCTNPMDLLTLPEASMQTFTFHGWLIVEIFTDDGHAGIGNAATQDYAGLTQANAGGNVQGLAALIFSQYLWAFELTSALLITAAIGAMILAHRERFERRKTQRELSIERFGPGGHPTPMPGPGVYARHNAVDSAARLPDGSYSRLSVPGALEIRTFDDEGVRTGNGSNGSQNGAS